MDTFMTTFYPLQAPNRHRDRPMLVLALGLSRMGTDSLRRALELLSYNGIYHGFYLAAYQPEDCAFWYPALRQKYYAPLDPITSQLPLLDIRTEMFDKVLGNMEAITDCPANNFSRELLRAYPDAKVILNKRRSIDAWHYSYKTGPAMGVIAPFLWCCSWFNTPLLWIRQMFYIGLITSMRGDFEKYGRECALEHYRVLEGDLEEQGREWLNWDVEEGWEGLCEFLGREPPREAVVDEETGKENERVVPFPRGNAGRREHERNVEISIKRLIGAALVRMGITAVTVGAVGALLVHRMRRR